MSIPDGWKPRHVEAFRAWEQGDTDRLCEACGLEIGSATKKVAFRHGLPASELREYARKGAAKAAARYDPEKGPFQAYARLDIYWEARRGAEALHKHAQGQELSEPHAQEEEASAGQGLADALRTQSEKFWRDTVEALDADKLGTLRHFLDRKREGLILDAGKDRYWFVRFRVFERKLDLLPPGEKAANVTAPGTMEAQLRARKARFPRAKELSDKALAKMYGVSDKTVARWRDDIEQAGPVPGMDECGTTRLKSKSFEDHMMYLYRIADPRGYRRLLRRSQQGPEE